MKAILYTDGGTAGGNPGQGYGSFAIYVDAQPPYYGRGEFGRATSNEAEYRALLLGLDEVAKLGTDVDLEIRLDSALLIGQLSKGWRVKADNLRPLWVEAKQKLGWFHSCKLVKVGRDEVVKVLGH